VTSKSVHTREEEIKFRTQATQQHSISIINISGDVKLETRLDFKP